MLHYWQYFVKLIGSRWYYFPWNIRYKSKKLKHILRKEKSSYWALAHPAPPTLISARCRIRLWVQDSLGACVTYQSKIKIKDSEIFLLLDLNFAFGHPYMLLPPNSSLLFVMVYGYMGGLDCGLNIVTTTRML